MKRKIEYVKVTRSNETGEIKKFVPFSDYEHDSFTVSKDEFEAIIRKQQWNKHSEENPIVIIDDEPIPVKKQKLNSNENAPLIQSTPARSELNSILSQEDLMRIFQLPYDYPQQPSIWDVVPPNQYSSKFFEAEVNLPLANKEPLTILVDDDSSPTTALAEQMDDSKNEFSKRAPVPEESLQDKEATPAPCQHSTSRDISFFQSKRKRNNVSISRHKKNQKILEELGIEDMLPEHYIPSAGGKSHLVYVGKVDLLKSFGGHGLCKAKYT